MTSRFLLKPEELDRDWFEAFKAMFKGKTIEILVWDTEGDETDLLMRSPADQQMLDEAMGRVARGEGVVEVKWEDLP